MLKAKKNVLKKKTASAKSVAKQRKATLAQKLAPNGFNSKVAVAFQRLEKVEKGIKAMMINHKPPAGASRQVVSTHHLPPHKMYDPELGMWTFPYRAIARTSVSPTGTVVAPSNVDPTNPLNLGLIDLGNGGSPFRFSSTYYVFSVDACIHSFERQSVSSPTSQERE
jgi:hypothetical protein